jgi:hypothetical protein
LSPELDVANPPPQLDAGAPRLRRSRFRLAAEWITLGSAISYAILHIAYSEFYDKFGLTPEEVGLGFSQVLATSLSAILFAFGVWALLWFLLFLPSLLALPNQAESRDDGLKPRGPRRARMFLRALDQVLGLIAVALALLWVGGLAYVLWANSGTPHPLKVLVWLPVLTLPVILAVGTQRPKLQKAHDWLARNAGAIGRLAGFAVVVCASWTTYHAVRSLSVHYANQAFSGAPVSAVKIDLPASFPDPHAFDIRADAARVVWLQGRPAGVRLQDCLLFLGSSGGISFLFDARTHETLRVSPSAIGIGSTIDQTSCSKSKPR